MTGPAADWRDDLDALRFAVPGHGAHALVHRLAFRALVAHPAGSTAQSLPADNRSGKPAQPPAPDRDACLTLFARKNEAFHAAAHAKIHRQSIPRGQNLHLNSRDIRRAMEGEQAATKAKACRVLGG
ncbi:hypothetical protein [Affinirhizobium pseudoryzae]|uniref:hypothetical protein n=1 Tax=Allorhizobium pseudoryzae TaxID=379684 RepID=UPI0013EA4383|nr:hypothetical protein [Allorhizobium pseudoryzae]